ncbi:MAG: NADPH:quinone reductase [Alphaproteobacteria bacterium]|nr:NADPH:quinone reductase [Alphaproteobacteria bacterium]
MVPERMRAAWFGRTGPAREVLELGELPTPAPEPGEVLVRVAVSGINPHDTKKRSGWTGRPLAAARIVPHADGAGRIAAVGHGVSKDRIGQRVWFFRADIVRPGSGSAAEYALIPQAHAVPLPDGVDYATGAALGVPGLTAYEAVFSDGAVSGRTVLVQGGAGAVGAYAIQLANWNGARVIATVSSPDKAAFVLARGAEGAIDYRREDVARRVLELTGGAGVDRIVEVDLGANLAIDTAVIKPHGTIASYSSTRVREPIFPYYDLAVKGVVLRLVQGVILPAATREAGSRLLSVLCARKLLIHPPLHRFPLARIAEAHEALESGTLIGKAEIDVAAVD